MAYFYGWREYVLLKKLPCLEKYYTYAEYHKTISNIDATLTTKISSVEVVYNEFNQKTYKVHIFMRIFMYHIIWFVQACNENCAAYKAH